LAPGRNLAAGGEAKVFWFFSSEKNAFLETRGCTSPGEINSPHAPKKERSRIPGY
jgi:hypothetical protein